MTREVRLSHLYEALSELSYPASGDEVTEEVSDVLLLLADGTIPLEDVIEDIPVEEYESLDELTIEIMSHLPRRAVGEPFQSEGDA